MLRPLQRNKYAKPKKYDPNDRTGTNCRQRTKRQGDSQPIRCRVQNTGSQEAHRNEYRHKIEEEVKAMQSEIKKNIQEANSEGEETGTQIKDLEEKEERNIQPEKNEETTIQKNEERLRNLQDILKRFNIRIIGVPEGEEEEQKIENLFEQINEGELPQSGKGNRLPGSPGISESQRS